MNDDRMRELARRVAAMAPEPPDYDSVVSEPLRPASSPRSPWLAVALGAVAVIVLVAVPLYLAGTGDEPSATQPSTTAPVVPTSGPTTTTLDEATTTTVVALTDAVVYLASPTGGSVAGNPTMVPVHRMVEAPSSDVYEFVVLSALFAGVIDGDPADSYSAIPPGVTLLGAGEALPGGILALNVSEEFVAGSGQGLLGDLTMLNQIVYTATALAGFDAVEFLVEGEPSPPFGSEGIVLDGPVDRTAFADESLALIVLDEPVHGAGAGEEIVISGIANVFEATVSYEILDDTGVVLGDGFITASCGTGCWGDFSTTVPITPEAAQVVVYWESAEDGSRHDVITRDLGQ